MARRAFFSFHYEKDIFRVSQVRNSGMTKGGYQQSGFIDHADWEQLKRQGDAAIKRWINSQLDGATVTVVLIGSETADRPWVNYEIRRSHELGMGLLGIHIHRSTARAMVFHGSRVKIPSAKSLCRTTGGIRRRLPTSCLFTIGKTMTATTTWGDGSKKLRKELAEVCGFER